MDLYLLPLSLRPASSEARTLPSGRIVRVAKSLLALDIWKGSPLIDTHGGKPVLDYRGRPAFAELAILWALMDAA